MRGTRLIRSVRSSRLSDWMAVASIRWRVVRGVERDERELDAHLLARLRLRRHFNRRVRRDDRALAGSSIERQSLVMKARERRRDEHVEWSANRLLGRVAKEAFGRGIPQ